jgi:subfamily B ATP-binding cassette protein MsbA
MRGRTTFVVSLTGSQRFAREQILVVEAGHHRTRHSQSLYDLGGRYYDLYTRQHGLESIFFWLGESGSSRIDDSPSSDSAPVPTRAADPLKLLRGT